MIFTCNVHDTYSIVEAQFEYVLDILIFEYVLDILIFEYVLDILILSMLDSIRNNYGCRNKFSRLMHYCTKLPEKVIDQGVSNFTIMT